MSVLVKALVKIGGAQDERILSAHILLNHINKYFYE